MSVERAPAFIEVQLSWLIAKSGITQPASRSPDQRDREHAPCAREAVARLSADRTRTRELRMSDSECAYELLGASRRAGRHALAWSSTHPGPWSNLRCQMAGYAC